MGQGSSPPARGLLAFAVNNILHVRLIPACAGTTYKVIPRLRQIWAHPRLRGDYREKSTDSPSSRGSSPPARGLHCTKAVSSSFARLIPACAGTTLHDNGVNTRIGAHPRLRGDYITTLTPLKTAQGSSPPARGLHLLFSSFRCPSRLIPACAGTTPTPNRNCRCPLAHPRLRGDYSLVDLLCKLLRGSSPPARGLLMRRRF